MKILITFGTRPEAIKMAPLFHKLNECNEFQVFLCVTGQHKEMLYSVLDIFLIKPDCDLQIMSNSQDLQDVVTLSIKGLKKVIIEFEPDLILVHGDTSTTMAASIAGFLNNIPVGHVEAGLRTNDIKSPFPEEFNRRVVSLASDIHFAPTIRSKKNLIDESILSSNIFVTGNTVIDSMFWILSRIEKNKIIKDKVYNSIEENLKLNILDSKYILITAHRRESFGLGFIQICEAINILANKYPSINFVYPVHLNPNVQDPVKKYLSDIKNVYLTSPLNYEAFVVLLKSCYLVITDSGGIQEEAPSLGKPVLVLRDTTERPEALDAGVVKLVGTDQAFIVSEVSKLIESKEQYELMAHASNPYGDGTASSQIVDAIKKRYL
tara:strand:+ start:468 stop:1604 length:1137 start_codon:yes stop_codon:yes gene_type:complete